ncbi:MAG: acetyl-CoA acetyltransferase [Acidimicrobiia bacterium]
MPLDPRTPVLVGVGQAQQRVEDPASALEPIDLLASAARAADADTRTKDSMLARVDAVAVIDMLSWRYPDPGALLARKLGASPRTTITTTVGGNTPQMLVNRLAAAVARGDHDIVLLGGAECVYTRWRARRTEPKAWLDWAKPDDPLCELVWGDDRPGSSAYEMAHLALAPTQVYPLFETALRAAAGRGIDEHQRLVSELWSGFSAVAAENPHAWSRVPYAAEDIRTVSAENRMVTFPYPKLMCANIDVDQAAALLLCSYGAARDAGVPDDRLVFPLSGADANDHYFFTERASLAESPAIRAAGAAALAAAGAGIDDVTHFDLYSCFPAAVQIAMKALGLGGPAAGDHRTLTVTGGLGFAGGPGNNYVTHSIAATVEACRRLPGSTGFVTALGWYVTKHSVGLYSTTPPPDGFVAVDPSETQRSVDALPRRVPAGDVDGDVTVEATSVIFDRDGAPSLGIVTALTGAGDRALANTRDQDALQSMCTTPWEGTTVRLRTKDGVNEVAT